MHKIVILAIMFFFLFLAEFVGWDDDVHYDFIVATLNSQLQGNESMLLSYG